MVKLNGDEVVQIWAVVRTGRSGPQLLEIVNYKNAVLL